MGVPKRAKSAQKQPPLQKNSSNKKTKTVKTTKSVKTTSIHFPTPQTTQNPPATSLTPRTRFLHELDELTRRTTLPPHLQTILRSATSGTFRDFWKNEQRIKIGRRTIKIGFYFFTYECCRRRLSLIKMIHGVEEVLILLFTAFRYEYLFWSVVVRVWIVRLCIREKIWFVSKRYTTKRRRGCQTKNIWREKCFIKMLALEASLAEAEDTKLIDDRW